MVTTNRNIYIDFLKALAIFFMILDHIAYFFLPADLSSTVFIRGFGRIAMPLFFITHGYLLAHRSEMLSSNWLQVRGGYFLVIGTFFTGILYVLNFTCSLNILFQFAYVELLWAFLLNRPVLVRIGLVFVAACYLAGSDLLINWLLSDEHYYVYHSIEYGAYPLFYSVAGSLLGYRPQSKLFQTLASVLLITTLSFEYNIFIEAILTVIADWSLASWFLTSLLLPILFWYIPQGSVNFRLVSPAITFVSRHALDIYFWHLGAIIFFLMFTALPRSLLHV